jgi:hypothetical protein
VYVPTAKNGMVAEHYAKLGFSAAALPELPVGGSAWDLGLSGYVKRNLHIRHEL